jgi:hypothetical protein
MECVCVLGGGGDKWFIAQNYLNFRGVCVCMYYTCTYKCMYQNLDMYMYIIIALLFVH